MPKSIGNGERMVPSEKQGRSRKWEIESTAGTGKGLQLVRKDGGCEVLVTRSQQTGLGMSSENRPSSFLIAVHFKLIIKMLPVRFQPDT